MITATATDAMIAPIIMIGSTQSARVPSKRTLQVARAPKAPIMNTSPWAKLIIFRMP